MNSSVLKALTGTNTCKLNNEEDLRQSDPKSFTATISGASKIYSLFSGTVLFLGFYKNMGTITIAVSNHEIIRYCNVKDIQIWNYSSVKQSQYLGQVYSNPGLQLEYCTQWKGESKYPVRINNNLYFKQNPIDILEGIYIPSKEIDITNGIVRPNDIIKFNSNQSSEWELIKN